jgi:hypothetical protein
MEPKWEVQMKRKTKLVPPSLGEIWKIKWWEGMGCFFLGRPNVQVFWKTTIAMVIDAQISKNTNSQKGEW